MSEEIKTELNEDETVCLILKTYAQAHARNLRLPKPFFQEDDFKVTSAFDDTRQEDDTDGLEDLERVSLNTYFRTLVPI